MMLTAQSPVDLFLPALTISDTRLSSSPATNLVRSAATIPDNQTPNSQSTSELLAMQDALGCLLQIIKAKSQMPGSKNQREDNAQALESLISSQGGLSNLASKFAKLA